MPSQVDTTPFKLGGTAAVEDPAQWAEGAEGTRQEGNWWPHWRAWIQARSGDLVDAPAKLGSRKQKPLGPAPGEYVRAK